MKTQFKKLIERFSMQINSLLITFLIDKSPIPKAKFSNFISIMPSQFDASKMKYSQLVLLLKVLCKVTAYQTL